MAEIPSTGTPLAVTVLADFGAYEMNDDAGYTLERCVIERAGDREYMLRLWTTDGGEFQSFRNTYPYEAP